MCGIAGWICADGHQVDRDRLVRMTKALAHRGPDAQGIFVEGPMGFGHRRLSVIDLSAASNQPMRDASGRFVLAFNGEIYNFREIRQDLEADGRRFSTDGDSEVALTALAHWGSDALRRFIGMFALALWDRERQHLLLARDRLGKKPLFFARLPSGGLVFASEPQAFRFVPEVGSRIDPLALAQYLQLNYVPRNRTLFQGVECLPPACYAQFSSGTGLRTAQYWDLASKFHDKRSFPSAQAAAEELRALIDDAVRLRLVSDVPLGAFLSGGVDSSTIVASMVGVRDPASVYSFSSGFVEDTYDESPYAEDLARRLGSVHRTQRLDTAVLDVTPAIVAAAQEPLADTSTLPTFFLSRFTRQHVTVALSGDGGDECFAGYETYVADKLHRSASLLPLGVRRHLPSLLERVLPVTHDKVSWSEKIHRFSSALPLEATRAHASWRNIFAAGELETLMQPHWRELACRTPNDLYEQYFAPHFEAVRGCDPLDQATYVDIKTWLADDILVKADRMSMAHSLEVRCPLLDHRLVEFAAQVPPELKLKRFSKKHILRLSQRGRVPDSLLDRPKRGFNAPVSHWILGPLRDLCNDSLYSREMASWFDVDEIRRLWTEHEQHRRDNGLKLFGLLTVSLFLGAAAPGTATRVNQSTVVV